LALFVYGADLSIFAEVSIGNRCVIALTRRRVAAIYSTRGTVITICGVSWGTVTVFTDFVTVADIFVGAGETIGCGLDLATRHDVAGVHRTHVPVITYDRRTRTGSTATGVALAARASIITGVRIR